MESGEGCPGSLLAKQRPRAGPDRSNMAAASAETDGDGQRKALIHRLRARPGDEVSAPLSCLVLAPVWLAMNLETVGPGRPSNLLFCLTSVEGSFAKTSEELFGSLITTL